MMNHQYRYIKIFCLAILLYVKYSLLLSHVEDMILERGIDIYHETVRLWWNRSGPELAAKIGKNLFFYPKNIRTEDGFSRTFKGFCYYEIGGTTGKLSREKGRDVFVMV